MLHNEQDPGNINTDQRLQLLKNLMGSDLKKEWKINQQGGKITICATSAGGYDVQLQKEGWVYGSTPKDNRIFYYTFSSNGSLVKFDIKMKIGCLIKSIGGASNVDELVGILKTLK